MKWLLSKSRWECAVLALIAAAVAYQIFADPIVGTADNRDWWALAQGFAGSRSPSLKR
jgi:hypothetical protein